MELSKIQPFLLHSFRDERDLVAAIEELSLKFTKERAAIGDYLQDERLASAYTAFYLLTNIPKFFAILPWLPQDWLSDIKHSHFVDLGAGPGTFSLAWREWVGAATSITQVETSEVMRRQANKLWSGLYPQEPLSIKPSNSNTILFFGHSANEMGAAKTLKYIQEYNPDHLLFVEPGTKDFYQTMMVIRDALLQQGYNVLYPCPSAAACPMKSSPEDWCHQFLHVKQESEVERISQMARKDRRNLPIIVHAYSRNTYGTNPESRIVRVLPETKFSFEWEVCHQNVLEHWQVMKRGLDKATLKAFAELPAGTAVKAEIDKVLQSSKRVRILSTN
jgi:ribosomal protein RSM22 (predicted rRNA methylase)